MARAAVCTRDTGMQAVVECSHLVSAPSKEPTFSPIVENENRKPDSCLVITALLLHKHAPPQSSLPAFILYLHKFADYEHSMVTVTLQGSIYCFQSAQTEV